MSEWLAVQVAAFLAWFSLPEVGLVSIFIVAAVAATLLPMGSEPALLGYIALSPHMFWPAIGAATLGNTVGGAASYLIGRGAFEGVKAWRMRHRPDSAAIEAARVEQAQQPGGRLHEKAVRWLERFGPPALLMSWVPGIGDPLVAVAGYLRFAFWPSILFMAIGKLARYVVLGGLLVWWGPGA